MKQHIFIAYSPRDKNEMLLMRENLLRIGYRPWVDNNPRPGLDWRLDIDDAIRSADAVLVIVTPAAAESVYVTYEWTLALGLNIPVIPVIFKAARMHPRLQMLENFDMTRFREPSQFWPYFTSEIQRILAQAPRPNLTRDEPVQPPQPVPSAQPVAPQPAYTRTTMPIDPGFWLVVRRGPELNKMFRLAQDVVTLGRDEANDITLNDPEISRFHLKLHWQGNGYAVEDLGSTNGTRIDSGPKIDGFVPLQDRQALMLGDSVIISYEAIAPR